MVNMRRSVLLQFHYSVMEIFRGFYGLYMFYKMLELVVFFSNVLKLLEALHELFGNGIIRIFCKLRHYGIMKLLELQIGIINCDRIVELTFVVFIYGVTSV